MVQRDGGTESDWVGGGVLGGGEANSPPSGARECVFVCACGEISETSATSVAGAPKDGRSVAEER